MRIPNAKAVVAALGQYGPFKDGRTVQYADLADGHSIIRATFAEGFQGEELSALATGEADVEFFTRDEKLKARLHGFKVEGRKVAA